jgi:hypothetical protein
MLAACAAPRARNVLTHCNIRIGGAVLDAAAEDHFAYRKAVFSACGGNQMALRDLLLFSEKADGEARLDHGMVLLALRQRIGVDSFDSISRSLGVDKKRKIDSLLETSGKFHRATVKALAGPHD